MCSKILSIRQIGWICSFPQEASFHTTPTIFLSLIEVPPQLRSLGRTAACAHIQGWTSETGQNRSPATVCLGAVLRGRARGEKLARTRREEHIPAGQNSQWHFRACQMHDERSDGKAFHDHAEAVRLI